MTRKRCQPLLFPQEVEFTHEISQVTLRLLKLTFEEAEREYRRVETEFITRAGGNDEDILDVQRRITAQILVAALGNEQPLDVCHGIWDELVQRGFSDPDQKCTMTGIYVRCCQQNGEFDEGIAVLEPLIAELEQRLEDSTLTPNTRAFCEDQLAAKKELRDELKAGVQY